MTGSSIQLSWTAPGDDGATGTATTYDVRYSTSTINDGNWAAATQTTGEPAPQVASSAETFTVTGLATTDKVVFNPVAPGNASSATQVRVSATNTLAVTYCNPTSGALTPAAGETLATEPVAGDFSVTGVSVAGVLEISDGVFRLFLDGAFNIGAKQITIAADAFGDTFGDTLNRALTLGFDVAGPTASGVNRSSHQISPDADVLAGVAHDRGFAGGA